MKTFIYSREAKKASYALNIVLNIYEVINNIPAYVAEAKFNTGSTPGDISEAMHALAIKGLIPEKYKTGYYPYGNQEFNIVAL